MPYKNLELELENLLSRVVESGASDLHLVPGYHPTLRVDSELKAIAEVDVLTEDLVEQFLATMLDPARLAQFKTSKDIDFSYTLRGQNRFRVNAYYEQGHIALALRFISQEIKSLQDLGLPPELTQFANKKQGLVLVVGPTGHGKSTTLAGLIDYINQNRVEHIITIEDPVEYIFTQKKSIIQQREVGGDTESFSRAIRATLREDANVIMLGEMRDAESISTAITVAETGHLVFGTLHTNDAAQTVDRIVDTFAAAQQNQIRSQLASILTGIISLRLVRKIGGGRIPAVEIMVVNDAVRNLIREGKSYELINVMLTGSQDGMVALDQSLAHLVSTNAVKLEDAKFFVQHQGIFDSRLKNINNINKYVE